MATGTNTPRLSPRRKRILFALFLLVLVAVGAMGGEIAARLKGIPPYRLETTNVVKVEPDGTFFKAHPERGYPQLPGIQNHPDRGRPIHRDARCARRADHPPSDGRQPTAEA